MEAVERARELNRDLDRSDPGLLHVDAKLALAAGDHTAAKQLASASADGFRSGDRRTPSEVTALLCGLATAVDDHRTAYELLREAEREQTDRAARYRALTSPPHLVGHATELRRQTASLKRSNAKLAASNRELRQLNDQAVELSARDPLTGLYNRRQLFLEVGLLLRLARRHGRPLSVAMVDIDRFKSVNDRYFHSTGDTVLEEVARLLSGGVRDSDLVGRYGGDEFVLLLPEVPKSGAAVLCERVRDTVARHDWSALADGLAVTVTIGIAEASAGESVEELLHRADQRLYLAKSLGRNQVAT